ncbi:SAF domain-containing protein [Nocardioides marmoraquaticus]
MLLHRRLLAALCAGGAVLLAVQAASPPAPPTERVWVATRALPGGTLLVADAVEARDVPPDLVPDDAVVDPADVVGRPLAAPVSRGEPLTRQRVVGPGLSAAYPGTAAVPVRFADGAVVDLLRPGDRVDVVAAPDDGSSPPALLVADVAVAAVPEASETAAPAGVPGRLVVLAVPRSEAAAVASATTTAVLIPVWTH